MLDTKGSIVVLDLYNIINIFDCEQQQNLQFVLQLQGNLCYATYQKG